MVRFANSNEPCPPPRALDARLFAANDAAVRAVAAAEEALHQEAALVELVEAQLAKCEQDTSASVLQADLEVRILSKRQIEAELPVLRARALECGKAIAAANAAVYAPITQWKQRQIAAAQAAHAEAVKTADAELQARIDAVIGVEGMDPADAPLPIARTSEARPYLSRLTRVRRFAEVPVAAGDAAHHQRIWARH